MLKPVNLRQHLLESIGEYLINVNPQPKTIWESLLLFFSGQGALGRKRAREYKNRVSSFKNEEELCLQVYQDVANPQGEGSLGSSKKLRKCLLNGLVKSFSGQRQVDQMVRNTYQKRAGFGFFDVAGILPFQSVEQSQALVFIKQQLIQLGWLVPKKDPAFSFNMK